MQSNHSVFSPCAEYAAVRQELRTILESTSFARSERLRNFLRFIVETTINNCGCNLKEYTIGIEVYGKDSSFDPRIDPIVRVDACRLRKKLQEYYVGEGRSNDLMIQLRAGTYVPEFIAHNCDRSTAVLQPPPSGARPLSLKLVSSGQHAPQHAILIAVLPFTNMTPDRDDEYLCDGLTEELINGIAKLHHVRVIPRTSVWAFKNKTVNLRQLGASLGVNLLVEGSVRKSAGVYRICVRVCDAAMGYELWSHTYNINSDKSFAVQDSVARAATTAIQMNVEALDVTSSGAIQSVGDLDNFDVNEVEALHVWNNSSIPQALSYFRDVLSHDSSCVQAYTGLADACLCGTTYGVVSPANMRQIAREAAVKGVREKRSIAESHLLLGIVRSEFENNFAGACREYEKVLRMKPNCPRTHYWYSRLLTVNGRLHDALTMAKQSMRSTPRSPISNISMGNLLYIRRDFARAADCYRQAVDLDPSLAYSHLRLSLACAAQRRKTEAITHAERGLEMSETTPLAIAVAGYAHGVASNKNNAISLLERLEQIRTNIYVPERYIALVYLGLGEISESIRHLKMASKEAYPQLGYVKLGTFSHHLSRHQEFRSFVKSVSYG